MPLEKHAILFSYPLAHALYQTHGLSCWHHEAIHVAAAAESELQWILLTSPKTSSKESKIMQQLPPKPYVSKESQQKEAKLQKYLFLEILP